MKQIEFVSSLGELCQALIIPARPDRLIYESVLDQRDIASMSAMYKWPFRPVAMPAPHIRSVPDLPVVDDAGTALWSRRAQIGAIARWPRQLPPEEVADVGRALGMTLSSGDRLFPVGPLVRPRRLSQSYYGDDKLFVNGGFFLCDQTEPAGPADAFGDPIGLLLNEGVISNAPVYARAAFIVQDGKVCLDHIGRGDFEIGLPNGETIDPTNAGDITFVAHGVDGQFGRTSSDNVFEVAFQRRSAVYAKDGGNMAIPKAGFVLRWSKTPDPDLIAMLHAGQALEFRLKRYANASAALQMGPMLLRGGVVVVSDNSFSSEEFLTSLNANLPPEPFPTDADISKAGRLALALDTQNVPHLIAVRGTSGTLNKEGRHLTSGLTLSDLASSLLSLGFHSALNLDGGASTQMFLGSGAMLFESRHIGGRSLGVFERPVSNVIECCLGS